MRNLVNKEKLKAISKRHTPESPFLVDLFNEFSHSNIIYCVLRNYEGLPYNLRSSDLDILVSPEHSDITLESIRKIARKHHAYLCIFKKNYDLYAVYVFGKTEEEFHWGVPIDLAMNLHWKGLDFYNIEHVFLNTFVQRGINVASSYDAYIITLLKEMLHNGRLSEKYKKKVSGIFKLRPAIVVKIFDRVINATAKSTASLFK